MSLVCAYCNTNNPTGHDHCIACGAPLEQLPKRPARLELASTPTKPGSSALSSSMSTQDLKQIGDASEKLYYGALTTYSSLWRTLGEALAIAVTAFILGLVSAATRSPLPGLFGALIVGLAVGLTTKRYWFAALSAPLGALFGALVWTLPWFLGAGPGGLVYTISLFAVLAAIAGGRPGGRAEDLWSRLRPWLGMAGALLFAVMGLMLGYSLRWLTASLLAASGN